MGEIYSVLSLTNKIISIIRAFMGMTTMCEIMAKMSRGSINAQDPASKAVTDKFRTVGCFLIDKISL
jgi:hypothetical protein